ncbi:DUF429 domain-containing protein [Vibrio paucivorans]
MNGIGIDGCKAGWVVWYVKDGVPNCKIVPLLNDVLNVLESGTALIDIPIGFSDPKTPDRLCDKAARKFLSPTRSASVFPVPCREACYAETYEQACEINFSVLGKKISKQTWFILPKVREVESVLASNPSLTLRESHPEVVFAALNGAPLEFGKKTKEGQSERLALIRLLEPKWGVVLDSQLQQTPSKLANKDDVIDAFVLMLVAAEASALSTLPSSLDTDPSGRVREIVYLDKCLR